MAQLTADGWNYKPANQNVGQTQNGFDYQAPQTPAQNQSTPLGHPGISSANNFALPSVNQPAAPTSSSGSSGSSSGASARTPVTMNPGGTDVALGISPTGQYLPGSQSPVTSSRTNGNPWVRASLKPQKPNWGHGVYKPKKNPVYADSEYLAEIRAIERALTAYRAKTGLNKTRAGTDYSVANRDLTQQRTRDQSDIKNDFAARGIVTSGVYGTKLGEYNQLWGQQSGDLSRKYKDSLTDITTSLNDYVRDANTQREQARIAAIRRRAQKLGKF